MRIKYLVLVIILSVSNAFAQDGNSQDVIYLKNGRVVKGTIVEKSPGGKLTIRTWSGYKFTYKKSEISKIEKEETGKDEEQADQNESKPTTKNRGHVIDNLYGDSKYFIQVYAGPDYSFQTDFVNGIRGWVAGIKADGGTVSSTEDTNLGWNTGVVGGFKLDKTNSLALNLGSVFPNGYLYVFGTEPNFSSILQYISTSLYYATAEFRMELPNTHTNFIFGLGYFRATVTDRYVYGVPSSFYVSTGDDQFGGGTIGGTIGVEQKIMLSEQMFFGLSAKGRYANIGKVSSDSATAIDGIGPSSMALITANGYSVLVPVTNAGVDSHSGTTRYAPLDYSGIDLNVSLELRF